MIIAKQIHRNEKEKLSNSLEKFIQNVNLRNKNTANQYYSRLLIFEDFIGKKYQNNSDELLKKINNKELDPYEILNDYCFYLQNTHKLSSSTFRDKIITTKTFLEYNDVELSPRKFKLKVRFPRIVLRNKEAIDKKDIIKILNSISDLRLKTYVMLLASTGLRATEALSIRIKDLNLNSNSFAKLTIKGEYTKTRVDRFVFLTTEMTDQMKIWLNYKHRKRRICFKDKETGKNITEYRTPNKNLNEFIFSLHKKHLASPQSLYVHFAISFAKTLDRIGMGSREDGNEIRREITLHSFRRFVKTTISDLGYADYSEWFIGHAGSTYWRKKEIEKADIFKKIEPYLTFLNIQQLNRQGADLETKIEELRDINQSLREKDKMKEDVIANLSDKLLMLSERLDVIEKSNRS